MNYYDPYLATWISGGQSAEQFVVSANANLQGLYTAANAAADVQTAFDTTDFALTGTYQGTAVPKNVAIICNWTNMCQSSLTNDHPLATDYQAIAFEPLIDDDAPAH
jgi:hypothetical protein